MRRLFWVSLGAVAGVAGYRRATAFVRSLRPAPKAAGSLASFTADVREGMASYMERQPARAPSALGPPSANSGERSASPGKHSAFPGAGPRTPRPGTPRWPKGLRGRGRVPSRTDELKDGR
jgi:hypothetical protein